MKKSKWFLLIGLALLVSIAFMGCVDTSKPVDPPIIPVPPNFEDIVVGNFWQVDGIEKYQDTRSAENPYRKDICMFWGEDGYITFWEDANEDGLLSPSEQINGEIPYALDGNTLTIDAMEFSLSYFNETGWAIQADVTGTTLGDWLGGSGEPYEGWVRIHYVPCLLGFDDKVITYQFAFVFDDMNDVNAEWKGRCWKRLDIDFDWFDGFYFTLGTPADSYIDDDPILGNHVAILNAHDGYDGDIDSYILVGTEVYGLDGFFDRSGFKPMHVYDMKIIVDSADVALFEFVSRVDGSGFDVDAVLDHSELGAVIIRGVDDVDVPVVNP